MKRFLSSILILYALTGVCQYTGPQLIICDKVGKNACDSVTGVNEFKLTQGSVHICCIVKGVLNSSSLKIRIRLKHHSDTEFSVTGYTPTDKYNCVYQDILIWNKGKHEIEVLDDKGARILIQSFVVR